MTARRPVLATTLLALAVLGSACGDGSDEAPGQPEGEAVTVTELVQSAGGEPRSVRVSGSLFDDGAGLVVCEALAESFPPQCPGLSLPIANPDDVVADFTVAGGVRWTDRPVALDGVVTNGLLEVTP